MGNENGGPAFPYSGVHKGEKENHIIDSYGMTLRDYFAAKVMQGAMASGTAIQIGTNHKHGMLDMAVAFYSMADAMLEARDRALDQ